MSYGILESEQTGCGGVSIWQSNAGGMFNGKMFGEQHCDCSSSYERERVAETAPRDLDDVV